MLKKTNYVKAIDCGGGNHLAYNTLLNNPFFMDEPSYRFYESLSGLINIPDFHKDEQKLLGALKESYLLVDDGFSEINLCAQKNQKHAERISSGQSIKFIDFRISEICNFACKHCMAREARSGNVMSVDTAIKMTNHIMSFVTNRNPKLKELDVHYGNAEPLMNFNLIREIEGIFNRDWKAIKRKTSINTNLSLLTRPMAKFLLSNNILIYASLDGEKGANDAIRVFKDGSGTYSVIVKKIKMLKNMGSPLEGVSVTLTDGNFKYFSTDSFINWCIDNGFISLAIDFDLVNSVGIPLEERVDFLVSTWEKCNDNSIEFFGTWITPFLNLVNRSIVDKHYAFCKGIHGESVSISPSGNIYICGSSSHNLGYYTNLENIFGKNGTGYNLFSSNFIANNEKCRGCMIEGACAGQCRVTGEYSDKKTNESCDYYRRLTEKLLISHARREGF